MAMDSRSQIRPTPIEYSAALQAATGGLHWIGFMALNMLDAREFVAIYHSGVKLIHLFPKGRADRYS